MNYKKDKLKGMNLIQYVKKSIIYIMIIFILFVFIGLMTSITSADRFSSGTLTSWTKKIESSTFLYLLGMESKAFQGAFPEDMELPKLSNVSFQIATSIKPSDPRSLLENELPGFSIFHNDVLLAGEGDYHMNQPVESAPPLEEILKDRKAVIDEEEDKGKEEKEEKELKNTTGDKEVVYIYNTHTHESFLPHLPDVDNPDLAHHKEVNITKVSDRLAESLRAEGIGTYVDETDIMEILNEKGWEYPRSYDASREVAREAIASNDDYQYVFDLHRDTPERDKTTVEIDGKAYAKLLIVIGAEHNNYEKNLELAKNIRDLLEEKYPGITRGVDTKQGAGTNGVFNQDLLENALLFEMGGVENNLDELYRTADALADVFSDFYWDAEKVDAES